MVSAGEYRGVVTDASGRVVRVVGSHPQEVLAAYCKGVPDRRLEAFGVAPTLSGAAPVRIGVIRDREAPEQLLAIAIREDHQTGRWFSGDGLRPIVPSAAPANAVVLAGGR